MVVVGIVGGIASGKSFVASVFREFGATVLDADKIGHAVLRLPDVCSRLVQLWGSGILDDSGAIDRAAVARLVFGDDSASRERLRKLEQITHPLIAAELQSQLERLRQEPGVALVTVDAAIMVETQWHKFCDRLVFVDTPPEVRLRNAQQRGWSKAEFDRRQRNQLDLQQKQRLAHATIDNSGTKEATRFQIRKLLESWELPVIEQNRSTHSG